jgi:hypothetical protein
MSDQAYDHEDIKAVSAVAGEITEWQRAALTLPLAEVRDVAQQGIAHLGCVLNDFNQVYAQRTTTSVTALDTAMTKAIRQATLAAIYTLAAWQRAEEAAALN